MTVTSNEEFAKRVMLLAEPAKQFQPTATYDPDGDCIEFLVSPEPFYAERVNDLVTVYYSQESDQVIGSLIRNVSKFCTRFVEADARLPDRDSGPPGQTAAHLPGAVMVVATRPAGIADSHL